MVKGSGQSVIVAYVRHLPLVGFSAGWTGTLSVGAVHELLGTNQSLAEAQSIAILDAVGVDWRFEVRVGDPANELMRLATEVGAETIVVAGRRHGALGAMACASVCTQLLHRWPRSLMVIHPHPEPLDARADTASGDQR